MNNREEPIRRQPTTERKDDSFHFPAIESGKLPEPRYPPPPQPLPTTPAAPVAPAVPVKKAGE